MTSSRFRASLRLVLEIGQVRRRLAFAGGHQLAVAAEVVLLLADPYLVLILAADGLHPVRGLVPIGAQHRPWPRERMVEHGDLVVQGVLVGLVEEDAFLDHRLAILVEWYAAGIVTARKFHA